MFYNGGYHGITVFGTTYPDDIIVNMQVPGEVFNVLPDYMKNQLEGVLKKGIDGVYIFKFTDGKLPPGLAMKLSRHISEAGFWYGSVGAK